MGMIRGPRLLPLLALHPASASSSSSSSRQKCTEGALQLLEMAHGSHVPSAGTQSSATLSTKEAGKCKLDSCPERRNGFRVNAVCSPSCLTAGEIFHISVPYFLSSVKSGTYYHLPQRACRRTKAPVCPLQDTAFEQCVSSISVPLMLSPAISSSSFVTIVIVIMFICKLSGWDLSLQLLTQNPGRIRPSLVRVPLQAQAATENESILSFPPEIQILFL